MNKRILIIDDDEDILEVLQIVFRDDGFNVVTSNTGEAADHIHMINPDVILIDVRLAGSAKSGDEICAEIKASYPGRKLPVVLVSAETDLEILANACGADLFIQKPFDIYELVHKVKSCVF